MHQSHGIGYAEYGRKLSKMLKVEYKREKSYQEGRQVFAEMERLAHR